MGTPSALLQDRRIPIVLAAAIGLLVTLVVAAPARAGGNCTISIEPDSVAVGGQFVVTGTFGANAEVHLVRGENQSPPEDSEPVYTAPTNSSALSATITMGQGTEGVWTVWGLIPATECGDSAILTVNAVPDTAMGTPAWPILSAVGLLMMLVGIVGIPAYRRRSI